jgi:aminoglycoside/choline kinase family phosphotransferase
MDLRKLQLTQWVRALYPNLADFSELTKDASPRRYFRFHANDKSYLAVDTPPMAEEIKKYINRQKIFVKLKILVPAIYHANVERGFLIIEDFGDGLLLSFPRKRESTYLYNLAFDPLYKLATYKSGILPVYRLNRLVAESSLFTEWFCEKFLKVKVNPHLFEHVYILLAAKILSQPFILIHKDYHSRNLILTPDEKLGVIDFQDAMMGPITYDIVSLLRDCYIDWPAAQILTWQKEYYMGLKERKLLYDIDFAQFIIWFDYMTMQRHLKTLGQFARFYLRDKNKRYLSSIPRTFGYICTVAEKYPEFADLKNFLATLTLPAICTKQ